MAWTLRDEDNNITKNKTSENNIVFFSPAAVLITHYAHVTQTQQAHIYKERSVTCLMFYKKPKKGLLKTSFYFPSIISIPSSFLTQEANITRCFCKAHL